MIHVASELASRIAVIAAELPRLSSSIRYYDDFYEKNHTIRDPEGSDIWEIRFDGGRASIDFSDLDDYLKPIFKHVAADLISRLDPSGATSICQGILGKSEHFIQALVMRPEEFRDLWVAEVRPHQTWGYALHLRTIIHSLCNLSIGLWRLNRP